MICTAISEKDFNKCMEMAGMYELAEIRLDLCRFSENQVEQLFSRHKNLVATCRPEAYSDNVRAGLLKTAIKSGARYVDVEIESSGEFIQDIKAITIESNCDLIISYHNFENTPPQKELEKIADECAQLGADVIKIACMVNNIEDNAVILSLLQKKQRLIALGMGPMGIITRIASLYLGAEFTFAAPDISQGTAPGQLRTGQMVAIIKELKKNGLQEIYK